MNLTIRNATGNVIGTPHVGSQAMTWVTRTTTLRALRDTCLQRWIGDNLERIATEGGSQREWLDQIVTVSDDYRY